MRRLVAAAAVAAALAGGLTACGDGDSTAAPADSSTPRALTADEADTFAAVRLNNYRREVVPFEIDVPVDGNEVSLVGRADMREHLAIAGGTSTPSTGGSPAYATFAWNLARMAVVDTGAAPTQEQLAQARKVPVDSWQLHDIESSTEPLDSVARVLLNLALDRTDNAQLLQQNGAQYLGDTTVDGKDVSIMSATPPDQGQTLTYYIDPETARLVRVDVNVGADRPATITFLDGDEASVGAVPVIKALGPTPTLQPSEDPAG